MYDLKCFVLRQIEWNWLLLLLLLLPLHLLVIVAVAVAAIVLAGPSFFWLHFVSFREVKEHSGEWSAVLRQLEVVVVFFLSAIVVWSCEVKLLVQPLLSFASLVFLVNVTLLQQQAAGCWFSAFSDNEEECERLVKQHTAVRKLKATGRSLL